MLISYCTKCGREVSEGSSFCQQCGAPLSSVAGITPPHGMSSGLTNEDFRIFIGKNSEKYLPKFAKFNTEGIDTFKATWHWPAFLVPFLWLLYRKLYGWAVLAFLTGFIPYLNIIAHFVWALVANRLYYKHAKRKLIEIKQLHPAPETQKAVITVTGGVGNAVLVLGGILIAIAILGVLAAIAIPAYMGYQKAAKTRMAQENYDTAIRYLTSEMSKYSYYSDNVTTSAAATLEGVGGEKKSPWDISLPAFTNGTPGKGQVGFTGPFGDDVKSTCANHDSITIEVNLDGSGMVNTSTTLNCGDRTPV